MRLPLTWIEILVIPAKLLFNLSFNSMFHDTLLCPVRLQLADETIVSDLARLALIAHEIWPVQWSER